MTSSVDPDAPSRSILLPTTAITKIRKNITHIFWSIISELFDPSFELQESLPLCDIIYNHSYPAILVIYFRYGFVFLLSGSVPDLVLDLLVLEHMDFFEVDSSESGL